MVKCGIVVIVDFELFVVLFFIVWVCLYKFRVMKFVNDFVDVGLLNFDLIYEVSDLKLCVRFCFG